jgi:UDP-N-acetyl-D-mannosaminuronic acid dehydrogenase
MRYLPEDRAPVVAVVGLGYVGSVLAGTLAGRGYQVFGVDTDPRLVANLGSGRCQVREPGLADLLDRGVESERLRVGTDYAVVGAADVVLVAVGTPVRDDGSLADRQLRSACLELSRHLREGQLLVLKSTVPPGTTRELAVPLLQRSGLTAGEQFGLAYSPERLAEGTALHDLRTLPIVVGGLDAGSTDATAQFWQRALGVRVIRQESMEAAEIVKLADNWWIDLNIALANELAKFCGLFDVDVLDVIAAANTIPKGAGGNVNFLLPSVGVGGSCLTKDPWMVWHAAHSRGLEIHTAPAGREVNERMPDYAAQLVLDEWARWGKPGGTLRVAVIGLAFKNNTGDLRATPVQGFVTALGKAGAELRLFDPLVDPGQAEAVFGIRPATSLAAAVEGADCLAILAHHREFADIDFATLPVSTPCLLLDGRAYYPKSTVAELRRLGYHYRGIGR